MEMMLVWALAVGPFQEAELERRIDRLVEQFASDSVVERDEASQELERIGPPALPRLREALRSPAAEARGRAQAAIRAIETSEKVRRLNREPRTLTLSVKDAPLGEVARAVAEQSGRKVEADPGLAGRTVSLELREASFLEGLDRLCAATRDLAYDRLPGGGARLVAGQTAPFPASYSGAFRLRLKSLSANRSQTFAAHKASLRIALEADHDGSVEGIREPRLTLEEVRDDRGGRPTFVAGGRLARPGGECSFGAQDLDPLATRLAVVRVAAVFSYPLDVEEVVFESPVRGDLKDLGGFTLLISGLHTDSAAGATSLTLSFRRKGAPYEELLRDVQDRFEAASVVLVDDQGREHPGVETVLQEWPIQREAPPPGEVEACFTFAQRLARPQRKALRLRFSRETWEKKVIFELRDVKLP